MNVRLSILSAVLSAALGLCPSCSVRIIPQPSDTAIRQGMSDQELREAFGEPIRVEHHAGGGQDWFYRFATTDSWSGPAKGWDTESYDPHELTSSVSFETAAVHLSPELMVTGNIPSGRVIRSGR